MLMSCKEMRREKKSDALEFSSCVSLCDVDHRSVDLTRDLHVVLYERFTQVSADCISCIDTDGVVRESEGSARYSTHCQHLRRQTKTNEGPRGDCTRRDHSSTSAWSGTPSDLMFL